ncbi:MAG: dihydropteroate synthase [bacterium]
MGILNITPDSFSEDGLYLKETEAIKKAEQMVKDGADIIDIGGESSRPGSTPISCREESERILPIAKILVRELDIPVSVDTYKSEVARRLLDVGVHIVNDISGLRYDPQMAQIVSRYDVPLIIMHMKGSPKNMQDNPNYESLTHEISSFLQNSINLAVDNGIGIQNIIIDPGIGFCKTVTHNLQILKNLSNFKTFGRPILIGTSRKSFIGKILDLPIDKRLEGTAATVATSILNGANIVRVHDVSSMSLVAKMIDAIMNCE